uniref:Uncharacterized protein n=1 Tax=Rhizophora mucronata TaxID=61149 RepID=A0A2P2N1T2_RHIMU
MSVVYHIRWMKVGEIWIKYLSKDKPFSNI